MYRMFNIFYNFRELLFTLFGLTVWFEKPKVQQHQSILLTNSCTSSKILQLLQTLHIVLQSGVPQSSPTYLLVLFLTLAVSLAHFTILHFTVRAVLPNPNSDTLEVPVCFLKLGATERFQWFASLWYRIPFASIKSLPILR